MTTLTLDVTGMTCGHCVRAVTDELTALDAVTGVSVDLHAGGTTPVTVETSADVAEEVLRAAVDEAGYELVAVRPGTSSGTSSGDATGSPAAPADPGHGRGTVDDARAGAAGRTALSLVAADTTPRTPKPEGHSCGCGCS